MIAVRLTVVLAACVLIPAVLSESSNTDFGEDQIPLSGAMVDEDIGYMNNVMDDYRRHVNPRLNIENGPPTPDMYQRYQVWKRNANIINTLLGFPGYPRRLLMAGR